MELFNELKFERTRNQKRTTGVTSSPHLRRLALPEEVPHPEENRGNRTREGERASEVMVGTYEVIAIH